MFGIIFGLSLLVLGFLGDNSFDKLFEAQSVVIVVCADDVVEAALDEFRVDVNAFEVEHVFLVEVLPRLGLREESVFVLIEFLEG